MKQLLASLLIGFTAAIACAQAPSAPGSSGRMDDAFEITFLRVVAGHPEYGTQRQRIVQGRVPSPVSATFVVKGSGQISGHWELVTPADGSPTRLDLTPTPSLNTSDRMSQRRFKQLGTFSFSMMPGERHVIHGPAIDAQNFTLLGRYYILLRLDSVTSISSTAPTLPAQVAPVIVEVENSENKN